MVKVHVDDLIELIKEVFGLVFTESSNQELIINQFTIKPFYIQFDVLYKDKQAEYEDDYDNIMDDLDDTLQAYSCGHARLADYDLVALTKDEEDEEDEEDGEADETLALKEIIIAYDYKLDTSERTNS